jgi:curved DNA-binding protein CbpA
MKNRRNYYRILHVQPDAPLELIKSSYRTLMLKLKNHPDLGGDHETAAVINTAYETLTDSKKRLAYDKELFAKRSKENVTQQHPSQRSRATDPKSTTNRPARPSQKAPPIYEKFDINTAPEQRNLPRVKLGGLASFYFEDQPQVKYHGTIIDFSPAGLQVQVKKTHSINCKICIRTHQLSAKGLISYCKPFGRDLWRIGIILLETSYSQRKGGFFRADA